MKCNAVQSSPGAAGSRLSEWPAWDQQGGLGGGGGEETNGLNGLHKTRYQVIWLCVEGRHQPTREARRRDGWNLLHVHFTSVYLYTPLRGPDDGAHWGEGGGRINADVEKKNAASFPSDLTDHIQTDQTT